MLEGLIFQAVNTVKKYKKAYRMGKDLKILCKKMNSLKTRYNYYIKIKLE